MKVSELLESLSKFSPEAEVNYSVSILVDDGKKAEEAPAEEVAPAIVPEVATEAPVEAVEPSEAPEVVAE